MTAAAHRPAPAAPAGAPTRRRAPGPTSAAGYLSGATDLVLRALAIQAVWVLGTLAGGIVLGWGPATAAAVDTAARAARGEVFSLRRAALAWRRAFWRSQVTMTLPGLLVLLALATLIARDAPLLATAPAAAAGAVLVLSLLHVPGIEERYDVPVTQVLGRAAVLALAQLPTTLILAAALALWAAICGALPGLVPFLGAAVPLLIAQHLVDRSLDRNEDLLARRSP
ncbi:hypothetical protein BF93_10170 [Brachybacterium phenoliresistens]|uniref:Uncharacterized protein n=1 Tax=Brachybacterium phenoliresistens TaxID=396014 RepID=Z9JPL7_9MICO|nr:DUF624 domain-containing protein [Brachybacterium phenoliresistens]EWS79692.1 hypothetical protein BF93_10170 [Brachybacterium phenoliresistens]